MNRSASTDPRLRAGYSFLTTVADRVIAPIYRLRHHHERDLSEQDRIDRNKVQGCASQVWLATTVRPNGPHGPALTFRGDSDAHIVRGLIAILFAMFSGRAAQDILSADAIALFERLGLREHLTPQRSNGFRSMVERIRADARAALAAT